MVFLTADVSLGFSRLLCPNTRNLHAATMAMVKVTAMKTTIRLTEGVLGERAIHVSNHSSIEETKFIKIGLE